MRQRRTAFVTGASQGISAAIALALARIPLRRFGTAEEIAGAVSYLASPAAAYITGQTLVLDGGLTSY